jgi:hypothetical protein
MNTFGLPCKWRAQSHSNGRTGQLDPDGVWVIATLFRCSSCRDAAWLFARRESDGNWLGAGIAVGSDLHTSDRRARLKPGQFVSARISPHASSEAS